MTNKIVFIIIILLLIQTSRAQIYPGENIDIIENGDTLLNPWLGGLDLPQFSGADFNRDGREDLLIFDKRGNKVLVLLLQEDSTYKYTSEFDHYFPELNEFALFKDYNCDGLVDIFTQTIGGIKVYQQSIIAGEVQFNLVSSQLKFDYNGFPLNLYNVNGDIPGIEDIDGDGDLDIVVFPLLSSSVGLFKNISQEEGYGCDSLIFEQTTSCWGYFKENNANNQIDFDISCKGNTSNSNTPTTTESTKHIGSTILLFDPNEDDKMDLLLGDVSFSSLVYLENDNTSLDAHMDASEVDYTYPSYTTPADVRIFPAAFYVDVTGDGKKDLIISPNSNDELTENTTPAWLYTNTGNVNMPFEFVKNNFLIDNSIDLGSFSYPTFFDHNADGLLDLIISNGYILKSDSTYISSLAYYENVGTDTLPIFELINQDYLGLSNLNLSYMRPTFGDLDGDGDLDLVIGDQEGDLYYFENTAGVGNQAIFDITQAQNLGLNLGDYAHPQLIDVNKDGLLDLLVGRAASYGEIIYYWNYGTTSTPSFSIDSTNTSFGNITTNETGFVYGHSSPFLLQTDSQDILYTGSDLGYIAQYIVDMDSLKSGDFYMQAPNLLQAKTGIRTNLSIVDINNDGAPDYFIGNSRGGINFYSEKAATDSTYIDTSNVAIQNIENLLEFIIYPNPTNSYLQVDLNNNVLDFEVQIFNILGQSILREQKNQSSFILDTRNLQSGVYYIKLSDNNGETFVKSFLKE